MIHTVVARFNRGNWPFERQIIQRLQKLHPEIGFELQAAVYMPHVLLCTAWTAAENAALLNGSADRFSDSTWEYIEKTIARWSDVEELVGHDADEVLDASAASATPNDPRS